MDSNNNSLSNSESLKTAFTQAANSLTIFYRESVRIQSQEYLRGQNDALKDIVNFALKQTNGDLRNISTATMMEYINSRINDIKNNNNNIESNILKENP